MTCVVVSIKHGCVASDTRCSSDNAMVSVNKIRRVGRSIIGAAGDWSDVLKFWDMIERKKKKDTGLNENSELEAIELHPSGIFLYDATGVRYSVKDEFFAIGSGGPYAMGAMAMGATPEEAVAIASRFDPSTGGEVEVMQLRVSNGNKVHR